MKLARYEIEGHARIGLVEGHSVVDLSARLTGIGSDMSALIAGWDTFREQVEALRTLTDARLDDVRLLAPITRPGKIWGLGLNYMDHIRETGREPPQHPTFFAMAQTSIIGPGEAIRVPHVSDKVDYEGELVFIVGRGGRHIPESEALDHIFGYCCGNDVSVRDWQRRTGQFTIGKSFDTHAPLGPWIVTADELDPGDLLLRTRLNNDVRQESRTSEMRFDVPFQLAHLSQAMTMEAGDVVFTGTPAGVGVAMDPPQFMTSGDVVDIEIEGIGVLSNPVLDENA